jgi:hypothetical protein
MAYLKRYLPECIDRILFMMYNVLNSARVPVCTPPTTRGELHMASKEAHRSFATVRFGSERQARRDRISTWIGRTFIAFVVAMAVGSLWYIASASDSELHRTVDAIWRYFHYFGGARPTE